MNPEQAEWIIAHRPWVVTIHVFSADPVVALHVRNNSHCLCRYEGISPNFDTRSAYSLCKGVLHAGWGLDFKQLTLPEIVLTLKVSGSSLCMHQSVVADMKLLRPCRKLFPPTEIIYSVGIASMRLSILALLANIFRKRMFLLCSYALAAIIVANSLASVLTAFLLCHPIEYQWNKMIPGGHCGDQMKLNINSAATNAILDFLLLLLPMPVIWSLQMPSKRKVQVSCVLGLGVA